MKTKIFKGILLLLLFGQMVNAQGWERYIDADSLQRTYSNDIINTDNGDYLILSVGSDLDNKVPALLSRFNAEGDEIWRKSYYNHVSNDPNILGVSLLEGSNESYYIVAQTYDNPRKIMILNVNESGDTLWTKQQGPFFDLNGNQLFLKGATSFQNGYSVAMSNPNGSSLVVKLDAEANIEYLDTVSFDTGDIELLSMAESLDGNLVIGVNYGDDTIMEYSNYIQKRDSGGNEIWRYELDSLETSIPIVFKETSSGDFVVFLRGTLLKLNADGVLQWEKSYPIFRGYTFIEETDDGGYIFSSTYMLDVLLWKTDANGEFIWSKTFDGGGTSWAGKYRAIQDGEGDIIIAGHCEGITPEDSSFKLRSYIIKTNSDGNLYENFVNGKVFHDDDLSCVDENEQGLDRILIEVIGNDTLYDFADETGYFEINLDTGDYEIRPRLPNPYWETCIDIPFPFSVTNAQDTLTIDLPLQADVECPYLEVDISTPFLRRCFDNTYYVNYCNSGTVDAEDPVVTVILDPFLEYQSSSIDLSAQYGDTLEFEIPDVAVGVCGSFEILTYLGCDSTVIGQTHCVTAMITPDSLCGELDSLWSGASLAVRAECTGDSIFFFIENIGTNDMNAPVNYIVTEDVIMYNEEEVQLMINESVQVLAMEGNGATWRLEVDQVEGHPGNSDPSIVVEGCVPDGEPFNLYFANIFPEDDGDPFISIDCQENIGSFDPNDKQGFPKGWDDDHFIERNQDIEYLIRFQNTGTDTAFTVVIKDPISTHLDISSIRPGASSHSYQMGFEGDDVLTFTFDNIMLPDSNINEAASHGFVKFKIAQKEDLELGTVINNRASIFFDFNDLVNTNETFHTIAEPLITVAIGTPLLSSVDISAFPNPFEESATIKVEGLNFKELSLHVFDINGRLISFDKTQGNQFVLKRNGLTSGMYFYQIIGDGKLVGVGKVIVQ